ncbi:MAG TPA: AbrB/MazE/SpoVT family DNA-binding domain-containing protein [Candidatus Nanoarchaeia archaeon]|nr:AbrB/MazE/SpoVT family DNA-binding domain-containing protein [Candidatus Nanoarchaeia archaeon]
MKRKVIQIANSTQLVSLPRHWSKRLNIRKGAELEVTEQGDKIVIAADREPQASRIELQASGSDLPVLRSVIAVYRAGYDEVSISFDHPGAVKDLPEQMNDLLPGYEVLQHTADTIQIRDIGHEMPTEFDAVLRRIFMVGRSIAESTFEMLEAYDENRLRQVISLEMTNNRLCNYCERLLGKQGYRQFDKTVFMYVIVWEMEKIADQYKYLIYFFSEHKKVAVSKETRKLFRDVILLFDLFYQVFYKFDRKQVAEIVEMRKDLIAKALAMMAKTKDNHEVRVIHHLITITQMTYNLLNCYLSVHY